MVPILQDHYGLILSSIQDYINIHGFGFSNESKMLHMHNSLGILLGKMVDYLEVETRGRAMASCYRMPP